MTRENPNRGWFGPPGLELSAEGRYAASCGVRPIKVQAFQAVQGHDD